MNTKIPNIEVIRSAWRHRVKKDIKVGDLKPVKDVKGGGGVTGQSKFITGGTGTTDTTSTWRYVPKKNHILSDAQRTISFRVRDQARSSRLSRANNLDCRRASQQREAFRLCDPMKRCLRFWNWNWYFGGRKVDV